MLSAKIQWNRRRGRSQTSRLSSAGIFVSNLQFKFWRPPRRNSEEKRVSSLKTPARLAAPGPMHSPARFVGTSRILQRTADRGGCPQDGCARAPWSPLGAVQAHRSCADVLPYARLKRLLQRAAAGSRRLPMTESTRARSNAKAVPAGLAPGAARVGGRPAVPSRRVPGAGARHPLAQKLCDPLPLNSTPCGLRLHCWPVCGGVKTLKAARGAPLPLRPRRRRSPCGVTVARRPRSLLGTASESS